MFSLNGRIAERCTIQPAIVAALSLGYGIACQARAQNIPAYFPVGNAGYDQELGVTVLSRARPLYESQGITLGGFVLRPDLDQSIFYNTNVNGVTGLGSWGSNTSGEITADSNWVRNRLSASAGFNHNEFFSLPNESYTDWHVGLAAGYTIDNNLVNIAYSHQTTHTLGSTLGAIRTETPTLNQTDTANLHYTIGFHDVSLTPSLSVSAYRFGNSVVNGQTVSEAFLNRNVVALGVDAGYALSDVGAVLVIARAANSTFLNSQAGQPSNNSKSFQFLTGLDYQARGPWRYRLLVGVETRLFQSSSFPSRTAPIIEGSVIWAPTGQTTVTGIVSREIEDPQSAGTNGYIGTQASLRVDHEVLPNVVLNLHGGAGYVQYIQSGGGQQAQFTVGSGVVWSLNRSVRLGLSYDLTDQTGTSNAGTPLNSATITTAPFRQSVIAVTLHLAL